MLDSGLCWRATWRLLRGGRPPTPLPSSSLLKSGLVRSAVARTVERLTAPGTAIIADSSKIVLGKAFPFEFSESAPLPDGAILAVDARYSLSSRFARAFADGVLRKTASIYPASK